MWIRSLLAMVSLSLLALPAHAIRVDLVQTGGTAIDGSGSAGDTLNLDVVATLEAGEGVVGIFSTLQWDLEGGNVLDLVGASEPASQLVNGTPMTFFSPNARIGSPLDGLTASGVLFDIHDALYPGIAGPEAFFGLEQVSPLGGPAAFGAATFTVGSLEFVLNGSDPTEISFYVGPSFGTVIGDESYADVTLFASLDTFRVNAAPIPEPSAWLAFAAGLLTVGARLSRARQPG